MNAALTFPHATYIFKVLRINIHVCISQVSSFLGNVVLLGLELNCHKVIELNQIGPCLLHAKPQVVHLILSGENYRRKL